MNDWVSISEIKVNGLSTSSTPPPEEEIPEEIGQIMVNSNVINNNGGTYKPEDFTVLVTGNNPNPTSFTGSSDGIIVTLDEGAYQVVTEIDGYDTSYSEECSGTISANDVKTCTITNNDDAQTPPPPEKEFGQLKVITNVIIDDDGTYKPEDFTVLVTGNNPNPF